MDRIEFLNSINYTEETRTNSIDILISFFDHYMVLYNLIENTKSISVLNIDEMGISFAIEYSDVQSTEKALGRFNQVATVYIYENTRSISCYRMSENVICITIR